MDSRLIAFALIAGQAWLLWIATDNAAPSLILTAAFVGGAYSRFKPPQGVWAWILVACGGFGFAVKNLYLFDPTVGSGVIAPIWLTITTAETLLLGQAVLALIHQPAKSISPWLSTIATVTMLCLYNQSIGFSEQKLYFVAAVFSVALMAFLQRKNAAPTEEVASHTFYSGAVLLIALALGWFLIDGWAFGIPKVRSWLNMRLSADRSSDDRTNDSYVRSGSLYAVSTAQRALPNRVALRVYANSTPGYLRGRAFDTYYNGSWHRWRRGYSEYRNPTVAAPTLSPLKQSERIFPLNHKADSPWKVIEVRNDPQRRPMYFLPAKTAFIRGEGRMIEIDYHGVVRDGIDSSSPYFAYLGANASTEPPSRELRSLLLRSPIRDWQRVYDLSEEICSKAETIREKIAAVEQYFEINYEFSLRGFDRPATEEPLSYFLFERPPAHCEFFASGSIALLRAQGIPCRYATGYIAVELDPEYGEHWLARNRDAHAWVEAWDAETGEWVIVESTPGIDIPVDTTLTQQTAIATTGVGVVTNVLAVGWASLVSFVAKLFSAENFGWVLIGIVVQAVLLAFLFKLRSDRRSAVDEVDRKNLAVLKKFNRQLAKRKIVRQPSETLHAFAQRLRTAADSDPWLRAAANWCEMYATVSYNPQLVDQTVQPFRPASADQG